MCHFSVRPNGSGEWSPGLRPKADALGRKRVPNLCGLKGRENPIRPDSSRGLSGRSPLSSFLPRASAFGLSPGLHSPDPLGRTAWLVIANIELWEYDGG